MSNYVSLEEAAKRLGVTADELVEMRSRGDIFGYRDGASWKFKPEEIDRARLSLSGDILDEETGGSSILVSENQVGPSGSKSGSTIGADGKGSKPDSDLKLSDDVDEGSDVALVPDPDSGSGVRLVNRSATPSNDDVLELADDDDDSIEIGSGSLLGSDISDIDLGSDLKIDIGSGSDVQIPDLKSHHGSDVLDGSEAGLRTGSSGATPDIVRGDSDPAISGSGSLGLGGELEVADEDDLVLGSGSDLGLAADSGINLMSPSDSGLSLEDEPLDLAGTGISGLDLAGEGSDPAAGSGSGISGSGSLVDFQQDEEFQLSPSGGIEAEEDSGSQVIELEDSTDFGDAVGLPGDAGMMGGEFGDQAEGGMGVESGMAGAAMMQGVPEVPYSALQVSALLITLLTCGMSAIFVTDIVRNMWEWNSSSDLTSWFTNLVMSSIGMGKS